MSAKALIALLRNLPLIAWRPTTWRGLIRVYSRTNKPRDWRPDVPLGWRLVREYDRNTWLVMPAWLYWPYIAKRDWRHWVYQPLIRYGFWELAEGDYYVNGHWSWPKRTR